MNVLSDTQVNILKEIGTCMLATSSNLGQPHCTIVEPSRYENNRIIIPIVQMVISKDNMLQNPKIFLHFYKIDPKDPEWSVQYKLTAKAKIMTKGKLFNEIKNYEETEVLPEGFYVNGIVVAKIESIDEFIG